MAGYDVLSADLDSLLKESDFVSVHCPLLPSTRHLINERTLRLMKPTAVLINTSRGPVVDEPALIRALTEKWIAAAGLDVFEQEPIAPDNPLLKLSNVVVTPHIAGYSDEFWNNFWKLSVETAIDLSKGQWPHSYVNHDVQPRWSHLRSASTT
jgi:phosphoglycerate dehydrogenase-like enzyme